MEEFKTYMNNLLENKVIISNDEYKELLYDQRFLKKLTRAGVDNWSGYDDVVNEFNEEEGD